MENSRYKFRVWLKNAKRMLKVMSIDFDMKGKTTSANIYDDNLTTVIRLNYREYELMQFTGRLDRNGKEVFEFDIVKTSHAVIPVGVIKYWQVYHSFEIESPNGDTCIGDKYDWSDIEVIGNVFSHPELIK